MATHAAKRFATPGGLPASAPLEVGLAANTRYVTFLCGGKQNTVSQLSVPKEQGRQRHKSPGGAKKKKLFEMKEL